MAWDYWGLESYCTTDSKLDFSRSGDVVKRLGQVLDEGARDFDNLTGTRGPVENLVPPQLTPHERQRVGEGRVRLAVPGGLAGRPGGVGHPLMRQQGDEREEVQQGRRSGADGRLGLLPLRFDAEM